MVFSLLSLEKIKMIKLEGTIINVFTQQGGKDKKTGEAFADRDKIQLLGEFELLTVIKK